MNFRIIMSNYTITINGEAYQAFKDAVQAGGGKQWFPLEVDTGRWIVPAHVIAIEAIVVSSSDTMVATHIRDM